MTLVNRILMANTAGGSAPFISRVVPSRDSGFCGAEIATKGVGVIEECRLRNFHENG